jgi:hypothetical protein
MMAAPSFPSWTVIVLPMELPSAIYALGLKDANPTKPAPNRDPAYAAHFLMLSRPGGKAPGLQCGRYVSSRERW